MNSLDLCNSEVFYRRLLIVEKVSQRFVSAKMEKKIDNRFNIVNNLTNQVPKSGRSDILSQI